MVYRCITVTWMPILQLSDPISSSPAEQAKSPAEPGLTIFEINTYDHPVKKGRCVIPVLLAQSDS